MVLQFLCARYPHYFSLYTSDASPDGRPDIFQNGILGTETNLIEMRHRPLEVLLDHIPEDFLLTKRNEETGKYELRAGVACSSIGWDVQSKIGKDLMAIHEPIPDYKEKMARSMDRYIHPFSPTLQILSLTPLPASSPKCPPPRPSNADPGASNTVSPSSSSTMTPVSPLANHKIRTLQSTTSISVSIGRLFAACLFQEVLYLILRRCLRRYLSLGTNRECRGLY